MSGIFINRIVNKGIVRFTGRADTVNFSSDVIYANNDDFIIEAMKVSEIVAHINEQTKNLLSYSFDPIDLQKGNNTCFSVAKMVNGKREPVLTGSIEDGYRLSQPLDLVAKDVLKEMFTNYSGKELVVSKCNLESAIKLIGLSKETGCKLKFSDAVIKKIESLDDPLKKDFLDYCNNNIIEQDKKGTSLRG